VLPSLSNHVRCQCSASNRYDRRNPGPESQFGRFVRTPAENADLGHVWETNQTIDIPHWRTLPIPSALLPSNDSMKRDRGDWWPRRSRPDLRGSATDRTSVRENHALLLRWAEEPRVPRRDTTSGHAAIWSQISAHCPCSALWVRRQGRYLMRIEVESAQINAREKVLAIENENENISAARPDSLTPQMLDHRLIGPTAETARGGARHPRNVGRDR